MPDIEISRIIVPAERRRLSGTADLAGSMAEVGLLNPITVTPEYVLIAGLRRLDAAKSLKWETIPTIVREIGGLKAELAEIDENLIRNEPTALERADLLKRRKEVYEALHPDTKAGKSQAAGMNRARAGNVGANVAPTFAEATATETGMSKRSVQADVKLATDLDEEAKADLKATPVADNKAELKRLAKAKPDTQKKAAKALAEGKAKTVKEAVKAAEAPAASEPAPTDAPAVPWAEWEAKADPWLADLRDLIRRAPAALEVNVNRDKQGKWSHFITHAGTIGVLKQVAEHVAQGRPAELTEKPPGYLPAHQVTLRNAVREQRKAV